MKSTILSTKVAMLFAQGADDPDDDKDKDPKKLDPPKPVEKKKTKTTVLDDDDEDDDEDPYPGKTAAEQRANKLTRENARRRVENKRLREENEDLHEAIKERDVVIADALKMQKAYDKLKDDNQTTIAQMEDMAIRNAIQGNEKLTWYDVNMVMERLDRENIAVDLKDFSVGGLEDQLKTIAKDKPFLVKSSEGDKKDETKKPPPSGTPPQSSATSNGSQDAVNKDTERKTLASDFPALNQMI